MNLKKIRKQLIIFWKKYFLLLILIFAGAFGGLTGLLCGTVSGIFLTMIYRRILEEKEIKNAVRESRASSVSEPFPGCIHLCAITYYCTKDAASAMRYISNVLSEKYNADWRTLCEVAASSDSINADLLTECLAVALKKANDSELIGNVFRILSAAEFSWNPEQGTKPSSYLAQLLNYSFASDELKAAYNVLGLKPDADLKKVKEAHRKLASRFHPDKSNSSQSVEDFVRIQNAYDFILKNQNDR